MAGILAGYGAARGCAPEGLRAAVQEVRRRLRHRGAAVLGLDGAMALMGAERGSAGPWTLWLGGAIGDAAALAAEVAAAGGRPEGGSDAMLVAAAWALWGEACLDRLEGGFVLAAWNEAAGRLVLARDRFGQEGLFYAVQAGGIAFASEAQAVLGWPVAAGGLDLEALGHALAFGHGPLDGCALAGLRQLPPGHLLRWERGGGCEVARWWRLPDSGSTPEEGEGLLREALGHLPAEALGRHEVAPVTLEELHRLVWHLGEPVVHPAALGLARRLGARQGEVVSGEGMGELLLLHPRYRRFAEAVRRQAEDGLLPAGWAPGYHGTQPFARDLYHLVSGCLGEVERLDWSGPAMLPGLAMAMPDLLGPGFEGVGPDWAGWRAARHDLGFRLPGLALRSLDAAAGMAGRAVLLPLLDHRLVAAVAGGAPEWRRGLARRLLPANLEPGAVRPSWEFGAGLAAGLCGQLREAALDLLLSRASLERGIFARARIEALGRGTDDRALWLMLGVELWCRSFLEGQVPVVAEPVRQRELEPAA